MWNISIGTARAQVLLRWYLWSPLKTNPGHIPRRGQCKFKQIKKARCRFHLSSSLFWGIVGSIVTVFSGGPRQCRGFMEVMVLFSGVHSPCQAASESYFPPVALLQTVYKCSAFIAWLPYLVFTLQVKRLVWRLRTWVCWYCLPLFVRDSLVVPAPKKKLFEFPVKRKTGVPSLST